jgi:hypothetical protein
MLNKTVLSMFPVIDDVLLSKACAGIYDLKISYTKACRDNPLRLIEHQLMMENVSPGNMSEYSVRDPMAFWSPDRGDLHVAGLIKIEHPSAFFSPGGIAEENTKIGIAILAFSPGWRNAIPVGDFSCQSLPLKLNFKCLFAKNSLRNNLKLRFVFYLANPNNKRKTKFATAPGSILGILAEYNLILEGTGSKFPVVLKSEGKQEPLWRVHFAGAVNVLHKFQDENVAVVLNEDHPAFKSLSIGTSSINESFLLLEIIASAMQIIFEKFKEEYFEEMANMSKDELQSEAINGTIFKLIYYHNGLADLRLLEPEKLALNIRKKFDGRYLK